MIMQAERELIVEYGKKLITQGLTTGTGGNISIFDRKTRLMAMSPSGVDYFETRPQDVAIINVDTCEKIDGEFKPSVEYLLHRIFYVERDDIDAIVHTHSTYATALATLGMDLPASSYLIAFAGPNVRCAPYRTFGTQELADIALEYMKDRYCVLLANHGLVAGGKNIAKAFNIALTIEECCHTYHLAKTIGEPLILSDDEMKKLAVKFQTYGQPKKEA